tara:strand:- start:761 stop:1438 length:678 start_codon:yes stop_codon:yes gene_type:complete
LLKTKDICPGKPESLYELGFILFKRPSIFAISGLISVSGLGVTMLYFILFGKTFASFVAALSGANNINTDFNGDRFEYTRTPYILGLGLLLIPILLKKELQELHLVSLGLFISILIFIFLLFVQLLEFGGNEFSESKIDNVFKTNNKGLVFGDFNTPKAGTDFFEYISSIATILVAFGFITNLFPIFSGMKIKTNENMLKTLDLGVLCTFGIYTFMSVTCILLFG